MSLPYLRGTDLIGFETDEPASKERRETKKISVMRKSIGFMEFTMTEWLRTKLLFRVPSGGLVGVRGSYDHESQAHDPRNYTKSHEAKLFSDAFRLPRTDR